LKEVLESGDYQYTIEERDDGTVMVKIALNDPENETWPDGTNSIKTYEFHVDKTTNLGWVIGVEAAVLVLLVLLTLYLAKGLEGSHMKSVAPVALLLSVPGWQTAFIVIFAILIVCVLAYDVYLFLMRKGVVSHDPATVVVVKNSAAQSTEEKSKKKTRKTKEPKVKETRETKQQAAQPTVVVVNQDAAASTSSSSETPYPVYANMTFTDDDGDDEGDGEPVLLEGAAQQILQMQDDYTEEADPTLTITDETGDLEERAEEYDAATNTAVIVQYRKSFEARVIQSHIQVKAYYTALKNDILSYKKTKSNVSWDFDRVFAGRSTLLKFAIRGKTLCVYMALDPNKYAGTKYKVEHADSKRYEDVPCLYRIKNARRAKYATELFADLAAAFDLKRDVQQNENYYVPYADTKTLVERGLIKATEVREDASEFRRRKCQNIVDKVSSKSVTAEEADSLLRDDVVSVLLEDQTNGVPVTGMQDMVYLDTVAQNFGPGDTVNLQSLQAKGLVDPNAQTIKVFARGTLDKPLLVEAGEFTTDALKMILITGGKARKVL
jgi:hypothetical protein